MIAETEAHFVRLDKSFYKNAYKYKKSVGMNISLLKKTMLMNNCFISDPMNLLSDVLETK